MAETRVVALDGGTKAELRSTGRLSVRARFACLSS
jgi:hypothetical protein